MTDSKKDKSIFRKGDRVFVKPYDCSGRVTKIEWRDELKLTPERSITSGFIYWVELDGQGLKPRGFSSNCLVKSTT